MAVKSLAMTHASDCTVKIGASTIVAASDSLQSKYEFYDPGKGMIGTFQPQAGRYCMVKQDVSGNIICNPTYAEAGVLLDAFMDASGGTYTPMDAPASGTFAVTIDKGNSTRYYASNWSGGLQVSWSENQATEWTLELLGTTEAASGSVGSPTLAVPVLASDGTITINSNTYYASAGRIAMTYGMTDRYYIGSKTRQAAWPGLFTCKGALTIPLNSDTWTDLIANLASTSTTTASIRFGNGSNSINFALGAVVWQSPSPAIGGDGVQDYELEWQAFCPAGSDTVIVGTA